MLTDNGWERVTVVGCGLIGASFALALRRAGACARVAGWDASPSVLDEALARGIIDEVDYAIADGGVSASDLVYLATPVGAIIEFLRERASQIKPRAVVTDAGSTKREVCRAARESLPRDRRFVGGHPVAGSHLRGPAHARADLFEAAPYVLTIDENERDRDEVGGHGSGGDEGERRTREAFAETLRRTGARVTLMTAREHDRAMALVSHLPQLVSSTLAATVESQPDGAALGRVAGAGFGDMTRLAASEWAVWRDILETNPSEVAAALDTFLLKLAMVRDELRDCCAGDRDGLRVTSSLFNHSRTTGSRFEQSQPTSAVKG
ncbi:MAG TPA: prephenate dehydrogenase/arogenate dehydrogenase family protein [Pyrinomonadaceae bacterium]